MWTSSNPSGAVVAEQLPPPPETGAVQSVASPMLKVTVPDGWITSQYGLIKAPKVTGDPTTGFQGVKYGVMVVGMSVTVRIVVPNEGANSVSPL